MPYEIKAELNAWYVESEPIVRCRDCKYYGCYDGSMWCSRTYEQVPGGTCDYQTVDPDGFCAWGERKRGAKMDYDAAEYQAAINPNTDFDR